MGIPSISCSPLPGDEKIETALSKDERIETLLPEGEKTESDDPAVRFLSSDLTLKLKSQVFVYQGRRALRPEGNSSGSERSDSSTYKACHFPC